MPNPVGTTFPTALAELADVKERLNMDADDDSDDDQLTLYLNSATIVLQNLFGDVIPVSYTEILRPWSADGAKLLTGRSPLVSVDSLSVTWPFLNAPVLTLSPNLYWVNLATGDVTIYAGSTPFAWQYAARDWSTAHFTVTYTAGRSTVTDNVKDAVLEILRINWSPQRGGNLPGVTTEDPDAGYTYMGFYIPNSAHERLAGGERPRQIL